MEREDEILFKHYNIASYADGVCDDKTRAGGDGNTVRDKGQLDTARQHGVDAD